MRDFTGFLWNGFIVVFTCTFRIQPQIELINPAEFTLREIDRVIVAGKTEPVVIYELLDVDSETLKEKKCDSAERFAQGLHCYRVGKFREARLLFAGCLVRAPLDEAADAPSLSLDLRRGCGTARRYSQENDEASI